MVAQCSAFPIVAYTFPLFARNGDSDTICFPSDFVCRGTPYISLFLCGILYDLNGYDQNDFVEFQITRCCCLTLVLMVGWLSAGFLFLSNF